MIEKIVRDVEEDEEKEEAFLSLIFPVKRRWVVRRPDVRVRRSILKKNISAMVVGRAGGEDGKGLAPASAGTSPRNR